MKRTIRENVKPAFTLHDRNVIGFEISDNAIIMKTQSGILETTSPYRLLDGFVEFQDVQFDFSYVYLLGVTGNVGTFTGNKMFLKDFIDKYKHSISAVCCFPAYCLCPILPNNSFFPF